MNILPVNQIQEAIASFNEVLLPQDNNVIRNIYIKMQNHGSEAIYHLTGILKSEALLEKMTIKTPNSAYNIQRGGIEGSVESYGPPTSESNQEVQRKLFQILTIIEPILLNEENVTKGNANGIIETFCDMLAFQAQNLQALS